MFSTFVLNVTNGNFIFGQSHIEKYEKGFKGQALFLFLHANNLSFINCIAFKSLLWPNRVRKSGL